MTVENTEIERDTGHRDALESIAENHENSIESEVIENVDKSFDEQKINVKIDGEELELPLSEVVKGYQKDATASKRLADAREKLKELEQREAELKERELSLKAKESEESTETQSADELPSEGDKSDAERMYQQLLYGDDEEGVKVVETFIDKFGRAESQAIPTDEIISIATQNVLQTILYNEALDKFKRDFSDVAEDDFLANYASSLLKQAAAESQTYEEAFEKVGNAAREKALEIAKKFRANERNDRKESLEPEPSRLSVAAERPLEKTETMADIIAEIRKQRGQM